MLANSIVTNKKILDKKFSKMVVFVFFYDSSHNNFTYSKSILSQLIAENLVLNIYCVFIYHSRTSTLQLQFSGFKTLSFTVNWKHLQPKVVKLKFVIWLCTYISGYFLVRYLHTYFFRLTNGMGVEYQQ